MKSLVSWLSRLSKITPGVTPNIQYFRVSIAGVDPLNVPNWLVSIDPKGELSQSFNSTGPESWSIIRLPDLPSLNENIHDRHRLGADLSSFLSLALNRRVIIPNDFAIHTPEQQVNFLPVSSIVDQGILGPLPSNVTQRLNDFLSAIAGLSSVDQEVIGAAMSVYQSALLAFDTEPRVAYTLLVAGIEALSNSYGMPPSDWKNWDMSKGWDDFFQEQAMTESQAESFRVKLMTDRQIRLMATFRKYASSRLSDEFWNITLDDWINPRDSNTGQWLPPQNVRQFKIKDLLPMNREGLSKMLGKSYDLRSVIVHKADWVQLMTFANPPTRCLDLNLPLPFPILRSMLESLIHLEITSRSKPVSLPNFQLHRNQ